MKYWKFDVCRLIQDGERNRRTLMAIRRELETCDAMLNNPHFRDERGSWEEYKKCLEVRETEYQMYVDMVALGMNDLPEVCRDVLQYWLIDKMPDEYIVEHCAIQDKTELRKIRELALTMFTNIVMPN